MPVDGTITSEEVTEPAVFIPEVARQHGIFICGIASRVVVSGRACF